MIKMQIQKREDVLMQTVLLQSVLLFVLLMVPGLLLGRSGLMQKNALPTLTNILLYAAMPSLVFQALCRLDPSTVDVGALLLVAAVPVVFETLWILLTALFAKEKSVVRSKCSASEILLEIK